MRSLDIFAFLLTASAVLIGLSYLPLILTSSKVSRRDLNNNNIDEDSSYGVICDAGSSGTRIFVYKFSKKAENQLIDIDTLIHEQKPVVKKVSPGLSSFANQTEKVIEYITPLLKFAESHIPREKLRETELLIFATAGMRLLPDEKKDAIVNELRSNLKKVTELKVIDSNIQVIDGTWEGIYSWISVNYILGKFTPEFSIDSNNTVGMIDMGGASVQLAFQLPREDRFSSGDVMEINLGPSDESNLFKYKLFSTTFLGFGANEGLRKYEQSLISGIDANYSSIDDPCDPKGLAELKENGKIVTQGSGKWNDCVKNVGELIGSVRSEDCDTKKCFLNSRLAPDINLSAVPLFGFSEYWYTTKNFGSSGEYNYLEFSKEVERFCSKSWNEIQIGFQRNEYPNAEAERLTTNCFKAAWISAVLHDGFSVDRNLNNFKSVLEINGEEMQWALGAMIYHMRRHPVSSVFGYDSELSIDLPVIIWTCTIFAMIVLVVLRFWYLDRLKYYLSYKCFSKNETKCGIWMV